MRPAPPPTTGTAVVPPDLAARSRTLNRTHAMAGLRARGGRIVRWIEERRRGLVAGAVRRLRPMRVVDVGCEDGWIASAYADRVAEIVLVDLDPQVLEHAREHVGESVRTVVADVTDANRLHAELEPGSADVVVLSALLEHLPRPAEALAALGPVLRPGGRFVIYVPADGPILFLKHVLRATRTGRLVRGLPLDPAPGHLHRFDRRTVARVLAPHGRVERLAFDPLVLGYLAVVRVPARGGTA